MVGQESFALNAQKKSLSDFELYNQNGILNRANTCTCLFKNHRARGRLCTSLDRSRVAREHCSIIYLSFHVTSKVNAKPMWPTRFLISGLSNMLIWSASSTLIVAEMPFY